MLTSNQLNQSAIDGSNLAIGKTISTKVDITFWDEGDDPSGTTSVLGVLDMTGLNVDPDRAEYLGLVLQAYAVRKRYQQKQEKFASLYGG